MILSLLMSGCSKITKWVHPWRLAMNTPPPGKLGAMFLSCSTLTSLEVFMILALAVCASYSLTRTSVLEALTYSVNSLPTWG